MSIEKLEQNDQGSPKDYKNLSITQMIRKPDDTRFTLPPLGVKSDQSASQQQQQVTQQQQHSQPQHQQQPSADYSYSTYQNQAYDPYQRQVLVQQQQQQQQQQQAYVSPSQYPIHQQSYSIASSNPYPPQAYSLHDYDQQQLHLQMQQSVQQQQAQQQQLILQQQQQAQQQQNHSPIHPHSLLADNKRGRRFRRRYNQIVRKYPCSFPGCSKSYGSLNHLNTHIVTKKHGHRKSKADFQQSQQHHQHQVPLQKDDLPKSIDYGQQQQQQQPSQSSSTSDFTSGNYWYGYPAHLRPTQSINSFSQSDAFNNVQPQTQQSQQQLPQIQNNNYMYYQGYQQQQQQSQQPTSYQQATTSSTSTTTPSSVPQQRVLVGNIGYYQQPNQQQQQYYPPPSLPQSQPQLQPPIMATSESDQKSNLDDKSQNQSGI